MPRSRSLTRFTMRVGLLHFGQSVLLDVSITFLRSAVLAILAMETLSPQKILDVAMFRGLESSPTKLGASGLPERRTSESASLFYTKNWRQLAVVIRAFRAANFSSPCYKRKSFPSEVVRSNYAPSGKSLDRRRRGERPYRIGRARLRLGLPHRNRP